MEENKSKEMNPLITVIVGIYNGEKYLVECLDSIVKQDYSNVEILLIDDGSKDSSGSIADSFAEKDSRVRVIHKENSGVSMSRNVALQMAKGEYICIIDQDDVISKDYVSYYYGLCEKNNAEVALTPSVDKFFGRPHKRQNNIDTVTIWTGKQAVIEMLYHKVVIAPWNKMIKKSLIDNNSLKFNPQYFNGEGFAFSIECFQHAQNVAVGKRKVYHYRVGDPNTGASKFKVEYINSSLGAQQYIKKVLVDKSPEVLKAWNFSNWHTHCDALNVMVGCGAVNKYRSLYTDIMVVCRKEAGCVFTAPISLQQKFRGILFSISPYMAAKIINRFRVRKFKKIE